MAINFPDSPSNGDTVTVGDKTWTWNGSTWDVVVSTPISNQIVDADGDTRVHVEESPDEDYLRFDTAGTERMTINPSGNVAMTGDLTVTGTIAVGSNTDVEASIANLESRPVETKTASYVLVAADVNKRIVMNSASATTITVNTGIFSAGDTVWIHNIGAGTTTVTAGTATVNTAGSLELAQWGGGALYFTSASTGIFFPAGGGASTVDVDFLVIGGGGAGGDSSTIGSYSAGAGGGGAGGYRNSYNNESSGGGSSAESALPVRQNENYTVSVGAGGTRGGSGLPSQFGQIVSTGGGAGAGMTQGTAQPGGSGGGGSTFNNSPAAGITGQGYAGGTAQAYVSAFQAASGGGGGAGGVGGTYGGTSVAGNGGAGVASTIAGSSVTRGGGGGGGGGTSPTSGLGGSGGGGTGYQGPEGNGGAATVNTGGGGGGAQSREGYGCNCTRPGGNGGSGIVIIRYPTSFATITIGAGLTYTSATDGSDTVVTFTAGEDTISWS